MPTADARSKVFSDLWDADIFTLIERDKKSDDCNVVEAMFIRKWKGDLTMFVESRFLRSRLLESSVSLSQKPLGHF